MAWYSESSHRWPSEVTWYSESSHRWPEWHGILSLATDDHLKWHDILNPVTDDHLDWHGILNPVTDDHLEWHGILNPVTDDQSDMVWCQRCWERGFIQRYGLAMLVIFRDDQSYWARVIGGQQLEDILYGHSKVTGTDTTSPSIPGYSFLISLY